MEKKSMYKRICLIFGCFMLISGIGFCITDPCYAEEGGKGGTGTSVTYVKSESEKFLIYVSIVGDGSVNDGEAILKEQVNKYEVEYGVSKTFRIFPDSGNILQKVVLDGKNITNQVIDSMITVSGVDHEQHLTFYFTKASGNDKKPNPDDKNNDKVSVNTGDTTKMGTAIILLISSLFALILLKKEKKDDAI